MKNSEYQVVRTSGAIVSVLLIVLCIGAVTAAWSRGNESRDKEKALKKAEVVGYQIAQLFRESAEGELSSLPTGSRSPASAAPKEFEDFRKVGTMSLDPWGQAYHYRLISADPKGTLKILVWSAGPNGIIETPQLKDEETSLKLEQHSFIGDDLGVTLKL
jgi:hypothetical protein